jgi:hypothetical protein
MTLSDGNLAAKDHAAARIGPSLKLQILNFLVFQGAWFAAVLGAARQHPLAGTLAVVVAIAWHLALAVRPAQELKLVMAVSFIGLLAESLVATQGNIIYTSGQPVPFLPPYWIVAMWALLSIALNVTMRWLKGRLWIAAALGAVVGPMALFSGARLGAARFVDTQQVLLMMACLWAVLMPVLVRLSVRFDGVARREVPMI